MTRWSLLTGEGPAPLGAATDGPQVLLLADPSVVLHRVRLAASSARARLAEARALAAELAATPADRLHLALGAPDADGSRWLAVIAHERMEAELARLEAAGAPPDRLVPAAALLPEPASGAPVAARCGEWLLVRGPSFAGAVEPALAASLGVGPDAPALEALLPASLPETAPDLLQGPHAPRRAFWKDGRFRVAAAALAALALLLALLPPGVAVIRSRATDKAMDAATLAIAARALGRQVQSPAEAEALLRKEAAARPHSGLAERLALALAAIEAEPAVTLSALAFAPDAGLALTLSGPAEAVNRVSGRLARAPFAVQQQGERLMLGPRRAEPAGSSQSAAEARLLAVRDLAPLVAAGRRAPQGPATERLSSALASAGIPAEVAARGETATVRLDAVRSGLLLPLVARLEASGTPILRMEVRRNPDPTVNALLEVR